MIEPIDYDGAWKETLERYLRPFLELCFPLAAAGIDWAVAIEFLDQELQQVVRDADLGKQRTDKLVKVSRRDGGEEWVLIHVEVQAQTDPDLALLCNDNYSSHSVPIKIPCGTGLSLCCVSLSFPLSLTLWARVSRPLSLSAVALAGSRRRTPG